MTDGLRKRPGKASNGDATPAPAEKPASSKTKAKKASFISVVDIFRAITGIAVLSTLASYLVTRGESYIWGYKRPWWTYPAKIHLAWHGPVEMSLSELAKYDGSTPGTPIYLAINRTIYDVSNSPQVYGPGGAYAKLAAKDASRSFVTTCFDPTHDLVPYLGGVEEVYVPLWLSKRPTREELHRAAGGNADTPVMGDKGFDDLIDMLKQALGRRKYRNMQEEAYEKAWEGVRDKIGMWENMFQKKEYPVIGRVIGVDDKDESKWKKLKLCEEAQNLRPPMGGSVAKAMEQMGKKEVNLDMGAMAKAFGTTGGGGKGGKEPETEEEKNMPEALKKRKKKKAKKEKERLKKLREASVGDMDVGGSWGEKGDKWWFEAKALAEKEAAEKAAGKAAGKDKTDGDADANNEI